MTIKELIEKYVEYYPDVEVTDFKGHLLCGLSIRNRDFSPIGKNSDAAIERLKFLEKFGNLEVEAWNMTARPLPARPWPDTLTVQTVIEICVKDLEEKGEKP